ncbi:MAG: translation initiation factor IF-2 [Syntrophomonadaceae bacterium]|jgi:translation initiation factor IF-2
MAKIRVHELAKELKIPSKELVDILQGLGLDIKNHMSTIEDNQVTWVKKQLSGSKETQVKSQKQPEAAKVPVQQTRDAGAKSTPNQTSTSVAREQRTPEHSAQRPSTRTTEQKTGQPVSQERQMEKPVRKRTGESETAIRQPQKNQPGTPEKPRPKDQSQQGQPGAQYDQQRSQQGQQRPQAGQQRPQTGQQRPQAGQQRPQTGQQRPQTGQQRPQTGQQRPQTGQQRPQTGQQRPQTGQQRPQTGQQRPQPGQQRPQQGQPRPQAVQQRPQQGQGKAKPVPTQRDYSRPGKKSKHKRRKEELVLETPTLIKVQDFISVRDLADKLNKTPAEIVKKLMDLGTMATINQEIDFETCEIICSLFEVKIEHELSEEQKIFEEIVDDESSMKLRPPVVTVMGHVDHGKTSLLDRIRQADVVSGEAGGITQHIGAYQVKVNNNRITFIDTPGHEAFTAMRARGANLTDIVILVVAADDGVMPQTVEAINHIRAAKVPFLVAVNKVDKPDANPDKVMQQLTEHQIVPEEWGGDTIFAPVSAKTGQGIDTLLEMVLLVAEVNEIKANPDRDAEGVVIEGELDKGRGAVATILVQKGTLRVGDCIICGYNWCKVRAMTDHRGRRVEEAFPSMPVEIMGWSDVPEAGERVQVCEEKVAKELSNLRIAERKLEEQKQSSRVSLDDFFNHIQNTDIKELNLIIKGDVQGSIEALTQSLLRLSTDEVKVHVIHAAAGAISETDVMLASASNAIIIGFNVRPDSKARKYAEEENIDVRLYRVIYEAIEDVKKAMTGLLDPEYKEKYLGRAEVRALFRVPNAGVVAGSYVIEGKIQRNSEVRVLRDGVIIYEGKLSSLRRFKDDAKEVMENYECGIGIKDFNDIKEGDIIEAYVLEEVPREL